jgi:hypothetical protein
VKSARPNGKLGPLPAGLQHGAVQLVRETVKDTKGAPAQPYRSADTVEMLLRRGAITGAITKEIATAADRFRRAFRAAGADRLRALDLTRPLGSGGTIAEPPICAPRLVNDAMLALGGERSLAGSALWYAIGLEIPISRWSLEHAGLDRHVGTGVLLAALGILAFHFAGRRSVA